MLMAPIFAAIMNFVSYFFDKIALAMYRAQPISRDQLPRVYNIVERLSQKVGLPMPRESFALNSIREVIGKPDSLKQIESKVRASVDARPNRVANEGIEVEKTT